MHILFLTDNFPPETNACASRVFERARYWLSWGHSVTVITSAPNFPQGKLFPGYKNSWQQHETMDGIHIIRVKTLIAANSGVFWRTLDFLSFMFTATCAGIRTSQKFDIVVATSPQFFTLVAGWIVAKVRKKPLVLEISDLWPASIVAVGAMQPNLALRILEHFELFLYRQSSKIITLTQAFKHNLTSRGIEPLKIAAITNGVDLRHFSRRPKDSELLEKLFLSQQFVASYIGTIGMAHGLERMLDVAQILAASSLPITLLLVGDGAEREHIEKQAIERKLNNIRVLPAQNKQEIVRYWSISDLAMVFLKNDPVFSTVIPSKMFEAMAMGIPLLLVAPNGEASNLLYQTETGEHCENPTPQAIAQAIIHLYSDPKLRENLAENCLGVAKLNSRERQARLFLDVLENVHESPT